MRQILGSKSNSIMTKVNEKTSKLNFKTWSIVIIFCLAANSTMTPSVFAREDQKPSVKATISVPDAASDASPAFNIDALIGAMSGLLGGGVGAIVGAACGHTDTNALIGTGAGVLGGIVLGAWQQAMEQRKNPSRSLRPPRWTISEEALVFDRIGTAKWPLVDRVPGEVPFSQVSTTRGTPALNSTDLHQGFSTALRLEAAYHVNSKYDLSISYFHLGDYWNSTKSVGPDNPPNWLVMKAPGAFFQTQDFSYQSMKWEYSSELYNAEFNVQEKISNRITVLAGFRWLQLNENLQGTIPPPDRKEPLWKLVPSSNLFDVRNYENVPGGIPATGDFPPFWNTSTTNNLYGLQIGADGKLFERGRFSLSGLLKAGAYLNHASQLTAVSLEKKVYEAGASTNQASFVGETGLQCKYQITSGITLKFGYEVLWLSGVALAPGQIRKTYTIAPSTVESTGIDSGSNVLFHGATAGFEFSF